MGNGLKLLKEAIKLATKTGKRVSSVHGVRVETRGKHNTKHQTACCRLLVQMHKCNRRSRAS